MNTKWSNAIIVSAALIVLAIALYQYTSVKAESAVTYEQAPKKNYIAPDFNLVDLKGETFHVGGKRDKMLLLNFWASWCEPCKEEAPALQSFYDQHQDIIDIYAVNSTKNDKAADAKSFVQTYKFTFPSFLDIQGDVSDLYGIMAFPTSYLVDQEGVIREVFYGAVEPDELERLTKRWMK
ncbi:hypothetical protein SY83_20580 [Paenibacillus swuensis]|uniref:Thioredoxin domain-containing protein n=1 Tax=Paenibacillus swuensis TaxID=1178515 RepID=A0A172TMJ0_9BACL|nr:TlpA disulfide reductase family protein [Paenibacillus swuensis]ANE48285.1 hypothetical protein SY83_20580 [Paenibacillus swuensis]